MSWQAWSLLILAGSLLAGFVWYERSRPSSRVVALVASLAALAVAGRVALAVVPNLVATTDIVLFAGYALGPAPGFVVGAISGLVSNFWLGQGPWTPWQMMGWGATGLMGAGLAVLVPRNPNRFLLAATAGVAALMFGLLMNFSTMATYGGEMTTERFAALQVRALPFDLMHVLGNVVLAFVAGPAMLRMLNRFKERMTWSRRAMRAGAGVFALVIALGAGGMAGVERAQAIDRQSAVGWLGASQNPDGGFGPSPDDESSAVTTSWVILGLAAAGVHPLDVESRSGNTPVDFLRASSGDIRSTGDLARTAMALQAAGVDPRNFQGRNLIADLLRRRRQNGSYENWPTTTAFALMVLRNAGVAGGISKTVNWLIRVQNPDGGWGVLADSPSEADSTGAVLQAVGARKPSRRGVAFLRRVQRPSGGFALGRSGPANAQSTAWVLQGLIAKGENPGRFTRGGRSGFDFLDELQMPDGHIRYSVKSDQTPVWVTANALVAASEKFFPVAEPDRQPPEPDLPPVPDGSGGGGAFGGGTLSPSPSGPGPYAPPYGGGGGGIAPGAGGGAAPPRTGVGPGGSGGGQDRSNAPRSSGGGRGAPGPTRDIPTVPAEAYQGQVEEKRDPPSAVAPTGIGLGLAGLTAGGLVLVGRRRRW